MGFPLSRHKFAKISQQKKISHPHCSVVVANMWIGTKTAPIIITIINHHIPKKDDDLPQIFRLGSLGLNFLSNAQTKRTDLGRQCL